MKWPNTGGHGKLTCRQYNGSSTVDYTLADVSVITLLIEYFQVHNWLSTVSDHCMISFPLICHTPKPLDPQFKLQPLSNQFKWDKGSSSKFNLQIHSPIITERLTLISNSTIAGDAQAMLEVFTNVLHTAAANTLRRKQNGQKSGSQTPEVL